MTPTVQTGKHIGDLLPLVAVADINGKLMEFLSKKTKRTANMTKLLTDIMPRGCGRKGGVAPRTHSQGSHHN